MFGGVQPGHSDNTQSLSGTSSIHLITLTTTGRPKLGTIGAQIQECGYPIVSTDLGAASSPSYQPFERFTIQTTVSITGTSINTPTTVARAAPD
jgi:hypothetical protein